VGYAAIVLAGGTARRMGGVAKPLLPVGGVPMLRRVLDAVGDAGTRIVVGPADLSDILSGLPNTILTMEDPPLGGPVAGIAAGLAMLGDEADAVCVLAADLPMIENRTIAYLAAALAARPDADVALVVDPGGHRQSLLARWRTPALHAALARLGEPAGASMRALLTGVIVVEVATGDDTHLDCDTDADWREANRLMSGRVAGRRQPDR
jgi:molybdopterin-guanine dinucleotide biosynthesis protein A